MSALTSSTDSTAGRSSSGGTNTGSTSTAVFLRYYVPLPLRVVNEDYALVAGFLGGIVIFAVYVSVLVCLRCLQQAQMRRPSLAPAQPTNSNRRELRPRGVEGALTRHAQQPSQQQQRPPQPPPPAAAAAAAESRGDVSVQRLYGAPSTVAVHYARGMQPLHAAGPPTSPPPPPPR
ncbi:hypothetical protein ABB37_06344 [Leptomonas pyrrhocoris]|uniref:Uncharacterized protein n=1 Tax=Leptomonas pyrrhocoris TaxID=157538 RepID=A0A0N0DU01_LEPPY|nr:hypothetical protein ABB37_06344 [Leptomonas pyrrhocoris]KPA78172.1 hypothetical protein ABB37_06344 [Leptomonas pyrrhocoris]|eukprot:XP_015656611.1 hypothetical protein ABB37_06344 [Leptomonas pyrrhocoris]